MVASSAVSPKSAASSLGSSQLLHLSSPRDMLMGSCTSELEPAQPSSGVGPDQCLLACDEDCTSLEVVNAAPMQAVGSGHLRQQSRRCEVPFVAADSCEVIRNELGRQRGLCYVPFSRQAQEFALANRSRIVSWLIEVATALALSLETLHASVSLLDRFVASTEVLPPETMLQLLAMACMSIAAKHEEVSQHCTSDWVELAVGADGRPIYQRHELQHMEWLLMETVDWRVRVPSTLSFMYHYQHVALHAPPHLPVVPTNPAAASTFRALSNFLAELALLDGSFLEYGYSTVAVACLVLAEMKVKEAMALAAREAAVTAAPPSEAPVLHTVMALSAMLGLEPLDMAPDLSACIQALLESYTRTTTPGPGGMLRPATELGPAAAVLMRYRAVFAPSWTSQ